MGKELDCPVAGEATMKRELTEPPLVALNLLQTCAIGRMTINFNWMEQLGSKYSFAIALVSPDKAREVDRTGTLLCHGFPQKLGDITPTGGGPSGITM